MAITENSKVLASDFIALKARVKTELSRRVRNGDISSYGGSNYDYTVTPTSNSQILVEHINKIVEPLNAVNSTGVSTSTANISPIVNLTLLDAKLTTYEGDQMVQNGHNSCNAACTGMCVSTCWSACTGCTGTCTGSCSSTCSGSCGGACSYGCGGSCGSGCSGGCDGSCTSSCAAGCASGCSGLCTGGCSGYCGNCGGCGNTCSGSCSSSGCSGCSGTCISSAS